SNPEEFAMSVAEVTTPSLWQRAMAALTPRVRPRSSALMMSRRKQGFVICGERKSKHAQRPLRAAARIHHSEVSTSGKTAMTARWDQWVREACAARQRRVHSRPKIV